MKKIDFNTEDLHSGPLLARVVGPLQSRFCIIAYIIIYFAVQPLICSNLHCDYTKYSFISFHNNYSFESSYLFKVLRLLTVGHKVG